ncbi:hypothetical protein Hanom_Chr00s000003g01601501 [Helianthus anomalus]
MFNFVQVLTNLIFLKVSELLKASIKSASLELAHHLAHSCDRLLQEVESQVRDPTPVSALKLKNMEAWLSELRSSMITLQKEAISAMLLVEEQQQQITLQKLLMIADAERSHNRHVLSILEELHAELILAKLIVPSGNVTQRVHNENKDYDYFIGKVIHPLMLKQTVS